MLLLFQFDNRQKGPFQRCLPIGQVVREILQEHTMLRVFIWYMLGI